MVENNSNCRQDQILVEIVGEMAKYLWEVQRSSSQSPWAKQGLRMGQSQ
jgi:hypothetical protein